MNKIEITTKCDLSFQPVLDIWHEVLNGKWLETQIFTLCMVCYLRMEPRSGEWSHCFKFNSPVPLACNALTLMGAQLRLRLTVYAPQCAHLGSKSRLSPQMGKPCKEQIAGNADLFLDILSTCKVYYDILDSDCIVNIVVLEDIVYCIWCFIISEYMETKLLT